MTKHTLLHIALVGLLSTCLRPQAVTCENLVCPPATVCAPDGLSCVSPADLSACENLEEGSECALAGSQPAECRGAVCTIRRCGDGLLMRGEACDDGNTTSCDGCSADCRSLEECGNGLAECEEQCDNGTNNSLLPNAPCRPDCLRQRCGDGVVDDRSGEDCDGARPLTSNCQSLGFYRGMASCSAACRADVIGCRGFCGDGEVTDDELCDGLPPSGQTCLDFGYDLGNLYCGALCTPQFNTCQRMGFRQSNFKNDGAGYFLLSVWPIQGDEVLVGGYNGLMLRFDGRAWSTVVTGATETIYSINGSSPNDIYAVGPRGHILHFDGMNWEAQVSGTNEWLNSVWVADAHDIFVVGRGGTLLRSTGNGLWVTQPFPVTDRLLSVWGTSATNIFIGAEGAIFHFDGVTSTTMAVPQFVIDQGLYLNGMWGSGPSDVFTVGELGTILHYDGTSWTQQASGTTETLNAIHGTGPDNVYAVGEGGVILHYNGNIWSTVPSGTTQTIYGVGTRGEWARAVGPGSLLEFGAGTPTISTQRTGMTGNVTGLWSDGTPNHLVATSLNGEIYRFDGRTWRDMHSGITSILWTVWGASASDIFAAGADGVILHFDGSEWAPMTSGTTAIYNWLWGTSGSNVYAVGSDGVVSHYDGHTWSTVNTGASEFFFGVWGSGPNDVYVVGEAGKVLHYDGLAWATLDTGTQFEFWGVWGTDAQHIFFFADVDGVLYYDGQSFARASISTRQSIDYGFGVSSTDMFAMEYEGQGLFHYNGTDWTSLRVPPLTNFSLWTTQSKTYLGAKQGNVVVLDRHCASREVDCGDRWDNDCDGVVNCADSDCNLDEACVSGGQCNTPRELSCGMALSGATTSGSPIFENYSCASRHESGQEVIYRFVPISSGQVTVQLSAAIAELDVIVLGTFRSGGCDSRGACLAASGAQSPRQVTFSATAGKTYYLLVDGADRATGTYELLVTCP